MHAIFHQDDGRWLIEDRKSTNGTFLEGVKLPAEQRRPVQDGASLRLADVVVARFLLARSFWGFCELVRGRGGPA